MRNQIKKLNTELEKWKRGYKCESLTLSICEIVSYYIDGSMLIGETPPNLIDGEIILTREPERINIQQKSMIIESLLLNIPLPLIYIQFREHGDFVKEVFYANLVTRAIMDFMGVAPEGQEAMPFTLEGPFTHLHSLEGMSWTDFTPELKRRLKSRELCFKVYKTSY